MFNFRKGERGIVGKTNDDEMASLRMKARFIDALAVGHRDMTFKEVEEFLFFNGFSVTPEDIANYFIEEGLLCRLDDRGYDVTDEGWDSGCLRSEAVWEQYEVGVSKCLSRVFVTVRGQQLLFFHFLKEG